MRAGDGRFAGRFLRRDGDMHRNAEQRNEETTPARTRRAPSRALNHRLTSRTLSRVSASSAPHRRWDGRTPSSLRRAPRSRG